MDETFFPFINRTIYNADAFLAMNSIASKTVRKSKNKYTRLLCWLGGIAGIIIGALIYPHSKAGGEVVLLYAVIMLLVGTSWNTFQARTTQSMMPKEEICEHRFSDEEIICLVGSKEIRYQYDKVFAIVEDSRWYMLFFDANTGIILSKEGFIEGDAMSFKPFIGMHTMIPIQTM